MAPFGGVGSVPDGRDPRLLAPMISSTTPSLAQYTLRRRRSCDHHGILCTYTTSIHGCRTTVSVVIRVPLPHIQPFLREAGRLFRRDNLALKKGRGIHPPQHAKASILPLQSQPSRCLRPSSQAQLHSHELASHPESSVPRRLYHMCALWPVCCLCDPPLRLLSSSRRFRGLRSPVLIPPSPSLLQS